MSNGLPVINIEFKQKAVSAIARSERGIAAVVVCDASVESGYTVTQLRYASDIPAGLSEENQAALKRCFLVAVNQVFVIALPTEGTFADAEKALGTIVTPNYICSTAAAHQSDLAAWVKTSNARRPGKRVTAVVAGVSVADDMHIINVKNSAVTIDGKSVAMPLYLPRLTALFANLPLNRSGTYYDLEDLDDVDVSFIDGSNGADSWVRKGYLIIIKDEGAIRIGRAVNSLTTYTSTNTEDMSKIVICESMDLIREDIYTTFKDTYVGKYKNSKDNQYLFITSVNAYLRSLAKIEVLDPSYDNHAEIDVAAQREAWLAVGKAEAADWDDAKVQDMSFKSTVYLAGSVKILDAVEDLSFTITME